VKTGRLSQAHAMSSVSVFSKALAASAEEKSNSNIDLATQVI